ncbi:hypothetical protein BAU15_06005 [Enterococcus sp. JM4C]|uniref:hypothetical protein n=1 Tax=Candidatus Enterococcus huntleyi TaxID=1857217 RepID=UPI00137B032D|nr:hypothetical protein [Enterococcus sp. JM4C]KAF1297103.1 hypothetical protein BAU15_06005 [Enterococcus sp. JM4C]
MKKKVKAIGITFIVLLCLAAISYTVLFFHFRSQFEPYIKEFTTLEENRSYYYNDSDNGFLLNVKYPGYGTLTGNLAVQTSDSQYALIIWPKVNNKIETGFQTAIINPQKKQDQYLTVKNGQIDLEKTSYSKKEQEMILSLEKEAKKIWGADVLG